jgi:hypothetical protein
MVRPDREHPRRVSVGFEVDHHDRVIDRVNIAIRRSASQQPATPDAVGFVARLPSPVEERYGW